MKLTERYERAGSRSLRHKYEQLPLRYTTVWNGTKVRHGIFISEWYRDRWYGRGIWPEPELLMYW